MSLIAPMWVAIAQLDTVATEESRAAPETGYSPFFREPRVESSDGGRAGSTLSSATRFKPPVFVRAQIERGQTGRQRLVTAGDAPMSDLRLVLDAREVESMGLVNPSGDCAFRTGDKLLGIYESCGAAEESVGAQTQEVQDPPGLKCIAVEPAGEGLFGRRNLFVLHFQQGDHTVLR